MSAEYEVVIGLEVHAELNTESKIFCGCKNEFGAEVNTLCCPVCTGMPGTLPVLNRQVVEYAVKMGHALHCTIHNDTKQDRKNYFYPDLPKAYQISQFDVPLCENGYLDVWVGEESRRIGVTRIHIEEDAGKLIHDADVEGTLADYNRCGVPLIEIVSEPDLRSADEAKAYMESIAGILLYLGISDAKMQEGSMRADVNVSVRPKGKAEYGTRAEMKNVNSFNAVHRAILFEQKRQIDILEKGGTVEQETRRWDDNKGKSTVMRTKEDAQDYRYFPDPDLLTFHVPEDVVQRLADEVPELPYEKTVRYMDAYGLSRYDAVLLCDQKQRAEFFDAAVALGLCEPKAVANWLLGDILKLLNDRKQELADTALTPKNLAEMIALIEKGTISGTAAKKVLDEILVNDVPPEQVVQKKGLAQISDTSALAGMVGEVLAQNSKAVEDYKSGKTNVLGFLVGQCMQRSRGQANPAMVKDLVQQAIEKL